MTQVHTPTEQDLIRFVYRETRLLDEKRYKEWVGLFTDDGYYWVPLSHDQPDGENYTSMAYEDLLLLNLRIERLGSARAYSQHPPSRGHHLLQLPEVDEFDPVANRFLVRTQALYTETRGESQQRYAVTLWHHLRATDDGLRMRLKRVDLLNCDAALPSIQLFI